MEIGPNVESNDQQKQGSCLIVCLDNTELTGLSLHVDMRCMHHRQLHVGGLACKTSGHELNCMPDRRKQECKTMDALNHF